jgi:hypothetical protein
MALADVHLDVPRYEQPDDVSCGPTCLRQVFDFYGDHVDADELGRAIPRNPDGGTLAVLLAIGALARGYDASIYSYNLRIFDPSWFDLDPGDLVAKLAARRSVVTEVKLIRAIDAYIEFLERGGTVDFPELGPALMVSILERGHPILVGLSATYLYRARRERPEDNTYDDIAGEPAGHFVVVNGYTRAGKRFSVCDPARDIPIEGRGNYTVPARRLLNAILLGDVTYDAVLVEISPRAREPLNP